MRRQVKFWQWLGRLAPIAGLLAVCLALYFDPDHWTDIIIIAIAISFGSIAFAWWWWVIFAVKNLTDMLKQSQEDFITVIKEIGDLLSSGKLTPFISETIPMAKSIDAIERIAKRGVVGKVVFVNN